MFLFTINIKMRIISASIFISSNISHTNLYPKVVYPLIDSYEDEYINN